MVLVFNRSKNVLSHICIWRHKSIMLRTTRMNIKNLWIKPTDTLILQDWHHYIGLEPGRQRIAIVMQTIHQTPCVHHTTPCDREREEGSKLRSRRRERWGQAMHQRRLTW
jgi:hypothetical protein